MAKGTLLSISLMLAINITNAELEINEKMEVRPRTHALAGENLEKAKIAARQAIEFQEKIKNTKNRKRSCTHTKQQMLEIQKIAQEAVLEVSKEFKKESICILS
ncbi:MAG: hypothetical protein UR26_C0002G0088 [candidate division TM6 bacterium GW2011_GWF2_32_72]|nr:MAG: hypothetical protein UR26_C0002G0088 [candidate division TM6 bacterium GW2011_GWF2_32_72]